MSNLALKRPDEDPALTALIAKYSRMDDCPDEDIANLIEAIQTQQPNLGLRGPPDPYPQHLRITFQRNALIGYFQSVYRSVLSGRSVVSS